MQLTSDIPLAKELSDREVREHTVESQINIGIPFQLRAMREHRGWTQETLAEKLGTTQNTVSRLENPKNGKPSVTTLLRVARVYDVGLLVRFVPFGFYGDVIEAMDSTHVEVPSYEEELADEIASNQEREQLIRQAIETQKLVLISGSGSIDIDRPPCDMGITQTSGTLKFNVTSTPKFRPKMEILTSSGRQMGMEATS